MRLESFSQQNANRGSGRPPMRTLAEFADDFGISPHALGKMLKSRPGAPAALYVNASASCGPKTYFPIRAMRAWFYGGEL